MADIYVPAQVAESSEQLQTKLNAALQPLEGNLANLERFSLESIYECNLPIDHFIKITKPLIAHATTGYLGQILSFANTAGIMRDVLAMSTRDFVHVALWLRTRDGQKAVATISAKSKLEKQGGLVHTPAQGEQSDYANDKKRIIERFAKKRDDINIQLANIEVEEEDMLRRLAEKYPAAANYKSLDTMELNEQTWEALKADCITRGIAIPPKNNQTLTIAWKEFGTQVRDAHLAAYCAQETVQVQLIDYANRKITEFQNKRNQAGVNLFRNLLSVATGRDVVIPSRAQDDVHGALQHQFEPIDPNDGENDSDASTASQQL